MACWNSAFALSNAAWSHFCFGLPHLSGSRQNPTALSVWGYVSVSKPTAINPRMVILFPLMFYIPRKVSLPDTLEHPDAVGREALPQPQTVRFCAVICRPTGCLAGVAGRSGRFLLLLQATVRPLLGRTSHCIPRGAALSGHDSRSEAATGARR